MGENNVSSLIKLNVGGRLYSTTLKTLTSKHPDSGLAVAARNFTENGLKSGTAEGYLKDEDRLFIDRDGDCFRYVLDYLRAKKNDTSKKVPADERARLVGEAEFYGLAGLTEELNKSLDSSLSCDEVKLAFSRSDSAESEKGHKRMGSRRWPPKPTTPPAITFGGNGTDVLRFDRQSSTKNDLWEKGPFFLTIGYRGSYTSTSDGRSTDVSKFRRITRITVSGRSDVAKEVFQQELNDSRDPERHPSEGYTCRYYLTHNYLESAFEKLASRGFKLVTSSSSGTKTLPSLTKEFKQWTTYIEYIFYRGLGEEDADSTLR